MSILLAQTGKPLSAKIIRNVMFGALRFLFLAPIPLILTPLILYRLGVKGYGTWAVFVAMSNLTSLADLGLVGTLSKYVAEYHAQEDLSALDRLLSTGLALFSLISALLILLLAVLSPYIISLLFKDSPISAPELNTLFRYFLIVIGANILTLLFSSVSSGLQRLDLTNMMSGFNIFCSAVIGGILLLLGWGLRGLLYGQIFSALSTVVIYVFVVRRLLPNVTFHPARVNVVEAKRIFGFSLQLYLTQAAVAVHNQIEKLFLAFFVGVAAAGQYDIASDLAIKVRGVIGLLLAPVLPAASELNALKDEARLKELYYRSHKYLAFVGLPIICYVGIVSSRFLQLWIGPKLSSLALPLTLLLVFNFINLATGPGFLLFAGIGYLRAGMLSASFGLILNISLSLFLIHRFGFAGAVSGTSLSLFFASALFMYLFHHRTGYEVVRLLRESYLKPALCCTLLLGVWLMFRPEKSFSWAGLFGGGLVFAAAYTVMLLFSQFFDRFDWDKAERFVPIAKIARRIVPVA
jgi:O-antigen/teichoic acid export membrane protein